MLCSGLRSDGIRVSQTRDRASVPAASPIPGKAIVTIRSVVGDMLGVARGEGKCNARAHHEFFSPARSVRTHFFSRAVSNFR